MQNLLELLIGHCTATPEGRPVYPSDIHNWHKWPAPLTEGRVQWNGQIFTKASLLPPEIQQLLAEKKIGRGWKMPGYTDLITIDGAIFSITGNNNDNIVDPWEITNGVAGINFKSRHFVYAGGLDKQMRPKDTRTNAQKLAMRSLVQSVIAIQPFVKVGGHYQFDKKKPFCPGFDMPAWLRSIGIETKNIYQ